MNISIFAKEAFLNTNPGEPFRLRTKPVRSGHLQRVSSLIRGDQIADYLGARFNPADGYENDFCVYVKPMVRKGDDFKFEGKKSFIDMIDGHNLGELAKKHPEVGVIVCSQADYDTMSKILINKIALIPQHHCNFERVKKTKHGMTMAGVIGTAGAFAHLPKGLREELAKRGMELIEYSKFFSRQDVIDFYQKIDMQIVWRPYKKRLSNPLKIVNAASFGIPTIALDEKAFGEVRGCYLPVSNFEEFLAKLDEYRSYPRLRASVFKCCIEKAEEYHIDNIAKLYKDLCLT